MLDEHYLIAGLDALSRAGEMDYFLDGHRGAALIAAYYLCRDLALSRETVETIRAAIDEEWMTMPLFAPLPDDQPDFSLVEEVAIAMEAYIDGLRQAGHNVIFPSLALKALHTLPEACIPQRIEGIIRLMDEFAKIDPPCPNALPNVPNPEDEQAFASFTLTELLTTMTAFDGRGQGWSGHLLTYAYALLDLQALGYASTAQKALDGFVQYICRIRRGPLNSDQHWQEHPISSLRPHDATYWDERMQRPLTLGHVFKYPYAYYRLVQLVGDTGLRSRCMDEAYRIF